MMTRLLTEPTRSKMLEAIREPWRRGSRVGDLVREQRIPRSLAVLLALESVEWRMGGALRTGAPRFWWGWFSVEAFAAEDARGVARVLADGAGLHRYVLERRLTDGVETRVFREGATLVREELSAHLGAPVRVAG